MSFNGKHVSTFTRAVFFGAHHKNLKEDRTLLSAKMLPWDSFWQYIRGVGSKLKITWGQNSGGKILDPPFQLASHFGVGSHFLWKATGWQWW